MNAQIGQNNPFQRLVELMATLRGPDGCPWDRKQTPESLKPFLVEECYEVVDAIEEGAPTKVRDELGDLLSGPSVRPSSSRISLRTPGRARPTETSRRRIFSSVLLQAAR